MRETFLPYHAWSFSIYQFMESINIFKRFTRMQRKDLSAKFLQSRFHMIYMELNVDRYILIICYVKSH